MKWYLCQKNILLELRGIVKGVGISKSNKLSIRIPSHFFVRLLTFTHSMSWNVLVLSLQHYNACLNFNSSFDFSFYVLQYCLLLINKFQLVKDSIKFLISKQIKTSKWANRILKKKMVPLILYSLKTRSLYYKVNVKHEYMQVNAKTCKDQKYVI